MKIARLRDIETLEQIFSLCCPVPISGCWLWEKGSIGSGYGYVSGLGLIHRVAFRLANGKEAKGLVCHTCDIPLCVNPDHLYDGTKSTNQKDAIKRGLSRPPPRKPVAVTREQIELIAMKMKSGDSLRAACASIGKRYQSLQICGRRETLNQFLGDHNALSSVPQSEC